MAVVKVALSAQAVAEARRTLRRLRRQVAEQQPPDKVERPGAPAPAQGAVAQQAFAGRGAGLQGCQRQAATPGAPEPVRAVGGA